MPAPQTDPLRACPLIPAAEEEPVKGISLFLEPLPKQRHQQAMQPGYQALSPSCPLGLLSQWLDVLMTSLKQNYCSVLGSAKP